MGETDGTEQRILQVSLARLNIPMDINEEEKEEPVENSQHSSNLGAGQHRYFNVKKKRIIYSQLFIVFKFSLTTILEGSEEMTHSFVNGQIFESSNSRIFKEVMINFQDLWMDCNWKIYVLV